MILRAYKYRIYPSDDQKVLLNKTFGCCRVVWNKDVEIFNSFDRKLCPKPEYTTTTEIKKANEWMNEISAAALQQAHRNFIEYTRNFFNKNRKKKIGRCKFKSRKARQSYRLPNQKFKLGMNTIRLEKIGNVKIIMDRRPDKKCTFKSVTVSKETTGKFFASVLVEEKIKKLPKTGEVIGVDLGLKNIIITSSGEEIANPKWFRENQAKLKKAQRSLSRKKKGSVRRNKMRKKVATIHAKISNQRKWFHHQISIDLVKNYDVIGFEDLNISGMLRNHNLAKAISDTGWGQLVDMISYKAAWYGKETQQVGRFFPSSKTCSHCGFVNKSLTLADREWTCKSCGAILNRDINAAQNIINEAMRLRHRELPMPNERRDDVRLPEMEAIAGEAFEKHKSAIIYELL